MTTTISKPEKILRIGSVSASIWKQTGKEGSVFYNVQFQRSYRAESATQYTDRFNHSDLLNLAEIARRAERWIATQLA